MKRGCIFQRGAIWYISYYDRAGKQHQESSRSKKRVDAERLLTSHLHDLDEGRPIVKAHLTFDELRDHFLTHEENKLRTGHAAVDAKGVIVPWVFWRMVAKGRRGQPGYTTSPKPIVVFGRAWKNACRLAGCPGRIPHDLRRTAVRNYIRAGVRQVVAMQ